MCINDLFYGSTIWYYIVQQILRHIQYIPRNMHMVFALLCFVVVIHWLIYPYPSGLLHWHCGNLTIAPVPAKQPWWIWINTSCEFIMDDCITTTKQSTTKPCAYFLGYTVSHGCFAYFRSSHCTTCAAVWTRHGHSNLLWSTLDKPTLTAKDWPLLIRRSLIILFMRSKLPYGVLCGLLRES